MNVENCLMPNNNQRRELAKPGPEGPIYMLNLIKFKEKAEYEDGRKTNLSGRDAYRIYGETALKLLPKYNAEMIFISEVTDIMIGVVEELWDEVSIVKYPSRSSLIEMATSTEWGEANIHRAAGIKGQLNIETIHPNWMAGNE